MTSITAIGACFNRPHKTVVSIAQLLTQAQVDESLKIRVVLADASTNNLTAELVAERWPSDVIVLRLDSDSFWAESMAAAEQVAVQTEPDYILWFNDDVDIANDAISKLLSVARESVRPSIVAGACRDLSGKETTYSGLRKQAANRPTSLMRVEPGKTAAKVDTFNGNLVLMPVAVQAAVGPIDPTYKHSYGDLDYGLRASALGIGVLLAPGWVGECDRNNPVGTWRDGDTRRVDRVRGLLSAKGLPLRPHFRYCRKHTSGHIRATIYAMASYARVLIAIILGHSLP